jgi:hypothetical protein
MKRRFNIFSDNDDQQSSNSGITTERKKRVINLRDNFFSGDTTSSISTKDKLTSALF